MVETLKKSKTCVVVYSGGKDGHISLLSAIEEGYEILCLVYCDGGRYHYKYFSDLKKIEIVKEHVKLMKKELFIFKIPPSLQKKSSFEKLILKLMGNLLKKYNPETIFTGDIPDDTKEAEILRKAGKAMNIEIKMPLEKKNIFQVIDICRKKNILPLIVAVEKNVDIKWLGKIADKKFSDYIMRERKKGNYIDEDDFQTLVIKSPLLKKKMKIIKWKIFSYDRTTYLKIEKFKFI